MAFASGSYVMPLLLAPPITASSNACGVSPYCTPSHQPTARELVRNGH
jgi:hypothetical protein